MMPDPGPAADEAPTCSLGEERLFAVLDAYWQALQQGRGGDPAAWIGAHPAGGEGARDLRLLAALHDAGQTLRDDSQAGADAPPPTGPGGAPPHGWPPPGTALGECRIQGLLGYGGMGEVYLARHEVLGREVAVKVLPDRLVGHPAAQRRFRKEVQLLARLDAHPHLAAAFHASTYQGRPYLVMEYVPGVDLAAHVRRSGPLPVAAACDYLRQVASGLTYAHRHGIVHRDIKPSNLILTPDGTIKILDLGLARLGGPPAGGMESAHTDAGVLVGTPDYMAPEQARDASRADARSDLYSLGCTFYYLLTGAPPFHDRTPVEKLMAHAGEEPAPVRQLRPDVPPAVVAVVQKLLAKQPDDRYPSARAFLEALDAATGAAAPGSSTAAPEPGHGSRWRGTWAAGLAAAAAVLLGIGLLWQARGPSNQPGPETAAAATGNTPPAPGAEPVPLAPAAAPAPLALLPALGRLEFYVQRRGVRDLEPLQLVSNGQEQDVGPIAPLGPDDALKLEGEFRDPVYWSLLWFDTAGVVKVEERSNGPEKYVEFPRGDELVRVDEANPPGVHVLLLVASPQPPEGGKAELEARLAAVGRPPNSLPPGAARLLRGAGQKVAAGGPLPSAYLRAIEERLPSGYTAVHALFLKTIRQARPR